MSVWYGNIFETTERKVYVVYRSQQFFDTEMAYTGYVMKYLNNSLVLI